VLTIFFFFFFFFRLFPFVRLIACNFRRGHCALRAKHFGARQ
jgi:hypothetical protein